MAILAHEDPQGAAITTGVASPFRLSEGILENHLEVSARGSCSCLRRSCSSRVHFWTVRLAQGLVCAEHAPNSDALLLENFDQDYLVFERAEVLRRAGLASRVLVPITASDGLTPNTVDAETAGVMARVAHLPAFEPIPIQLKEPISLNAAYQIRDFLLQKNVRSVVVVAPGFRSRRSTLVYRTVLEPAGISVGCVPVFGTSTPENWSESTHGIQGVAEQFLKLQYYSFYALW